MSRIIVDSIRNSSASSDGITLSSDGKVTFPNTSTGKLLQVVQTMKTDTFSSTTATTWTDITGVTVNITPSSTSSKILVTYQGACSSSDDSYLWLRIARVIGATTVTDLALGTSRGSAISCTVNGLEAAPQGSKKYLGKGRMIEVSKRVKPWRELVRSEAIKIKQPPIKGACYV